MKHILAAIVALTASSAAMAGSDMSYTARNPHKFTMTFAMTNFVNGDWKGDASFTISACPEKSCFHLSGKGSFPTNPKSQLYEGTYAVPGMACDLHFVEVPHEDIDSGDWRITPVGRNGVQNGCASLPAGFAGVYAAVN